jgi:hypothetical protein
MSSASMADADRRHGVEAQRLLEDAGHGKNWKRWGPYLSERQWGTVREDYSEGGACWEYFPHDHARSRAYRWGEDGLLGICDREGRLCFALALWNGKDPILKERLFGLSGPEGNHGEDVKECYYYLDATPTASYLKALYKYPQAAFPYARLVGENRRRGKLDAEFELADTGVFDENRYFDVQAEYAKVAPDDLQIRITISNRGPEAAPIRVLPTLWFRNTWSWNRTGEGYWPRPKLALEADGTLLAEHASLGRFRLAIETAPQAWLFTENESNTERLWNLPNAQLYVKDAFHEYVVGDRKEKVNPARRGTKAAALYAFDLAPGASVTVRLRLMAEESRCEEPFVEFERTFSARTFQADEFYDVTLPAKLTSEDRLVARQAYAGLLWSKQFYAYVVKDWLEGDPGLPSPASRRSGRNSDWPHFYARDVLSMPDKWEYPWFAAWDLAFHTVAFAKIDPEFAKDQLILLLREWYSHPNGQLPAYEFAFGDVNPPVHPWACWRIYKMTGARGKRDRLFLERTFQKLFYNFAWWVNRKDADNDHLFSGGFLGLDNIGVFDRSQPLPSGSQLEQADGTAWMAFSSATLLSMALELAREDAAYEDVASKLFEHFIAIADAANTLGGSGLWNEEDGFYYDQIRADRTTPLRIRSMVGIIPLFAVEVIEQGVIDRLPGFSKRLKWFLENRKDLADHISWMTPGRREGSRLLALPSRERLLRVLRYVLDEREFLSPYGVRSLSRIHLEKPFVFPVDGHDCRVDYVPGESTTGMFGGNSNWRGPVWFPLNYLLIEALERYHHFYGDTLRIECPTGSGRMRTLHEVAVELETRLTRVFLPDASGRRPVHAGDRRYAEDPYWRDLVLFYEYFHGETGRGIGASHQTGWTAVVVRWLEDLARERARS